MIRGALPKWASPVSDSASSEAYLLMPTVDRLPSFLQPFSSTEASDSPCISAQFCHSGDLGSSHTLWWPPLNNGKDPQTILLFIPGNPGVVDFYIPFLSSLRERCAAFGDLAILARGHLDHYFGIKNEKTRYLDEMSLNVQVQSSIEVLDAIVAAYSRNTKIILIGHSVGSWIVTQILKSRADIIAAAFLLFPTISNIAETPNGKLLSPIFSPLMRSILSFLTAFTVYLPEFVYAHLYAHWPPQQLRVLRDFLSSPTSVLAALSMAYQEMKCIRDLDLSSLECHKKKLYFYYAQDDDWVGKEREHIFRVLCAEEQSLNMRLAPEGIPHAFCISEESFLSSFGSVSHVLQLIVNTSHSSAQNGSTNLSSTRVATGVHCFCYCASNSTLGMSNSPEAPRGEASQPQPSGSSHPPRLIFKLPSTPRKPARNFFIAPPHLSSTQKRQYKPASETSLYTARVDKVIGEAWHGGNHFYFAQYDGGIAYRYPALSFEKNYPNLVEEYEEAKRKGGLPPFDPSAQYVHPKSRMKNEPESELATETESLKIRLPRRTHTAIHLDDEDHVPDSQEEETSPEEESDEDDEEFGNGSSSRRPSTRQLRSKPKKELPFSPRKTRSQKIIAVGSESELTEESDNEDEAAAPPRRSTRTKKAVKINLVSDDEDYVEENRSGKKAKGHGKAPRRKKSSPPMYGHVRSIDCLDDDPFSDDEENEALRKKAKGRGRKRKRSTDDEFEESEGEETYLDMGGWVRCLKCPVSAHWKCLASNQRDEVLKAIRDKDREDWESNKVDTEPESIPPKKRSQLEIDQTTEFLCGACTRGGICMGCKEVALTPEQSKASQEVQLPSKNDEDVQMKDVTKPSIEAFSRTLARELFFRCFTCKRLAHYAHLPVPPVLSEDASVAEVAWHYQDSKSWLCADCSSYKYGVDKIIAWRPYPPNAIETQEPNYKAPLPREYLVKWIGKSYRRLDWVPHMWLASTHPSKLKNFISGGTKVELLEKPDTSEDDAMEVDGQPGPLFADDSESRTSGNEIAVISSILPMPDAEKRIPRAWKRVDRVLDVLLLRPKEKKARLEKKQARQNRTINSSDESDSDDRMDRISSLVFGKGEQPPDEFTETVDEWESRQVLEKSDINNVIWAFIKWDELGYDEATWDAPPRPNEPGYAAFKRAFDRFIDSREVLIPKQSTKYWEVFDDRKKDDYRKFMLKSASDLDLGQDSKFKLMPFQVDGFNWLCSNWWNHQHCILADEMGLGKTVQIVSFLGRIANDWKAFPALVVVPNSTITNWVREFERWAPRLRVVPFYGEKAARDVIKKFELFHETPPTGSTKAKFHILITTYEALTNGKDFTTVFKNQPRWEVLVVDEGQRLKSDSSLLFKKLNELNSIHRIILTGTPLNNNMRELFNLMNFLDPVEWKDLEALEKQHEVLDEELIKQLHNRLRPYFLRRVKSEVLDLPPKNEVIVPISMAPLQREVYRSILTHNLNILNGLTQPGAAQSGSKSRINNVLMQLRKCLQHPYLYAEDIEPRNLSQRETHEKLIDASGKLRFLKSLLPKLKEHGHRVLLFSQASFFPFIFFHFLICMASDGNTKGNVRQKAMDEFNKPDSEYFIFLLTTRAGGVGINLFTADTVIIFDPDFNPHQDLQAIARAYRYGQQKTCLVFKLMVKDSAEERIMQIGKKKLVLDHLIVQKMDDDEDNGGENIQSILTYGAQALFEGDQEARDITYTDNDIEKLLEKTEKEAVKEAPKAAGGLSFSFAKIWSADKDAMEDVVEDDQTADSWAMTLAKINAEREKEQQREIALSGRGARRKAADVAKTKISVTGDVFTTPKHQKKTTTRSPGSDGSSYLGSDGNISDGSASGDDPMLDGDFEMNLDSSRNKSKAKAKLDSNLIDCGLCGQLHASGECQMIDRSENLAEYREMLILHADDEPWEERNAAVQAIDEILYKRGHLSLIAGQPLHPLPKAASVQPPTQAPLPTRQPQLIASASASMPPKQAPAPARAGPSTSLASTSQASLPSQDPQKKKQKTAAQAPCVLCNQGSHLMKDCSIVRAGSKSISTHIKLLEAKNDPSMSSAVEILRNLLAKAKARELLAQSGSAVSAQGN
ncbi:hypothetical protein CVT26_002032 [Gymnopilus dilepis]|uniref:Chromatin remodeling factor mit1 n=1 Tax=Gymnopilus dilepis TaxID=231916 RepID=A0A409VBU7_9AGAR|nr:hypothetical protein CVT26_002032 [Gymnopilus dilepis]